MTEQFLVGLDVGTSVVKAVVFDLSGRERGVASRRSAVKSPQIGWSEVSLAETWSATADTLREAIAAAAISPAQIVAVGVTGAMVGAWLIDEHGQPIRDAILWNDGRTQAFIEGLIAQRPTLMADIFAHSGSVMQQGCTLPVLRWLMEHEPKRVFLKSV